MNYINKQIADILDGSARAYEAYRNSNAPLRTLGRAMSDKLVHSFYHKDGSIEWIKSIAMFMDDNTIQDGTTERQKFYHYLYGLLRHHIGMHNQQSYFFERFMNMEKYFQQIALNEVSFSISSTIAAYRDEYFDTILSIEDKDLARQLVEEFYYKTYKGWINQ